ncbi:MAG: ankyrin repeat domain-containing protein [Ignavibacteriales bacterium]|nr:ankyrin repeat domain-containing protein [Ignavibacteriales bacterium]
MREEHYDISGINFNFSIMRINTLSVLWICALVVAIRMNYEATFLTWEQGPQMIGFSFVHSYGALLILASLILIIITFIQMVRIIIKLFKKSKIERQYFICFIISIFFICLNFIPYSVAQTFMIHSQGLPKDTLRFFTNAAHDGDLGIMKLMIKKRYQPDSTVFSTCLFNACFSGHRDVIEYSLEHGANINYQTDDFKTTPLMIAAEKDESETIEFLLAHGANPRLRDEFEEERTALDWAVYYKNKKSISILSKYK